MSTIVLRIAGYPQAYCDGAPVIFATRFDAGLFLYLALNPATHDRATLACLLWPDQERTHAMADLRGALFRLKADFGPWLDIRRSTVCLTRNECFLIDREGMTPIGEGLRISPAYNAWLYSIRRELPVEIPTWWQPQSKSANSHLVDACRERMPALALRGEGAQWVARNYGDIANICLSAPDPVDRLDAGTILFYYTLLTGFSVDSTRQVIAETQPTTDALNSGKTFVLSQLSFLFQYPENLSQIVERSSPMTSSSDYFARACQYYAAGVEAATRKDFRSASEYSQVATSYTLALKLPFRVWTVVASAKFCTLSTQWIGAQGYVDLARALAIENGSHFLMPQIEALQKVIDHHD